MIGRSTESCSVYLKKLKTRIPTQAQRPMRILFFPSLSLESLTREQKTPTIMTLSRLQLLTMTTAGNEA